MKSLMLGLVLPLLFTSITAYSHPERAKVGPRIQMTGLEDVSCPQTPEVRRERTRSLDEYTPGSVLTTIGQTWYDYQHNGTAGKMAAVDPMGNVHFAWTHATDGAATSRHIFYNVYFPDGTLLSPGGTQVDNATRSGFVTIATNDEGFGFPCFHQITATNPHSAVSLDFLPTTGAFTTFEMPALPGDLQIIWPKIAADINGDMHIVSTENGGEGWEYYTHAHPVISGGFGDHIEWVGDPLEQWVQQATFITIDVAASWHSNRIAVAWIQDPIGEHDAENVNLLISEDGGANWGDIIPVTGIPPIDTNCVNLGGDPMVCNADTFRPWIDLSMTFDNDDNIHVAFTAHGWFYWDSSGIVGPNGFVYSTIWHWDDFHNEYNIINDAWFAHDSVALGVNNLMCHRPSLAIDTTTGKLYCSFQQFDSLQYSETGFPQADAYISVSETNGRTWSQATNITGTDGGVNTPAGQCLHERDITLAQFVTRDTVHVFYQLDLDGGSAVSTQAEGTATLNDQIYQQVPVTDIPARPLINPYRAFRADSTGYPFGLDTTISAADDFANLFPESFALYQNYPNPFNPSTRIRFDLYAEANASLKIFDITGREVAVLLGNKRLTAGTHAVDFDGAGLASGVYLYRLETPQKSITRKMMLVK